MINPNLCVLRCVTHAVCTHNNDEKLLVCKVFGIVITQASHTCVKSSVDHFAKSFCKLFRITRLSTIDDSASHTSLQIFFVKLEEGENNSIIFIENIASFLRSYLS